MGFFITIIAILLLLALIVAACIIFTNAVEHLGVALNLSEGAVGSVLAAVGTAMPETIVPIVAIIGALFTHTSLTDGQEIGIGAILGAPFLLGTLAFFVTGIAVFFFHKFNGRSLDMPVNVKIMKRDMHYFMIGYLVAISASFIHVSIIKYAVAVALVTFYGFYVYRTVNDSSESESSKEDLEPLYISKWLPDNITSISIQLILSILAIIILAHYFVVELENMAHVLNIAPLILSLIITPIATELPEKFNSVLWIKNKKDTLALGNITGAMVFQSCIPPAIGITLTNWELDINGILSVILVYISIILIYINLTINKNILKPIILVFGGLFYLIYVLFILYSMFNK